MVEAWVVVLVIGVLYIAVVAVVFLVVVKAELAVAATVVAIVVWELKELVTLEPLLWSGNGGLLVKTVVSTESEVATKLDTMVGLLSLQAFKEKEKHLL